MAEVLIVGAGPVGLMTALGLAREGVSVTLLEAEDDIVYSPRAISYAWSMLPALMVPPWPARRAPVLGLTSTTS